MSMEGLPRSCRYCAEMVCGDVNYCECKGITISDKALPKVRKCSHWVGNDIAADSFEVWEPKPKSEPRRRECGGQEVVEPMSTPKEQPKTCWTCGHSAKRHYPPTNVGHPIKNDLICLRHAVSTRSDRSGVPMPCGMRNGNPAGWQPKASGTIEQRCQQLEQAALDMLGEFKAASDMAREGHELVALFHLDECRIVYGERLRDLGVEADG